MLSKISSFKKGILVTTAFGLVSIFASQAFAAGKSSNKEVAEELKQAFPKMKFSSVAKTPVEGVYEVIAGDNVLYFAPESKNIIFGEIWDTQGKNLTAERKAELMSKKLSDLPLDKAVKIGSGKNVVIEVTDPDCPFCRKGSRFLDQQEDLTRYIFFYPLPMHPKAPAKSKFVLAAKDQVKAYHDVMNGKYDKVSLPEFKDEGLLDVHLEVARKMGVRGTPNYWVNGQFVSGANTAAIKKALIK